MNVVRSPRAFATAIAAYLAAVSALVACSLTTSLDGLSNGPLDGDSGPTSTDGSITGDTARSDAGGTGDGAAPDLDAAASDAEASVSFCDSRVPKPTFCDDFNRPSSDVVGGWGNRVLSGGGVLTLGPSTRTPTGGELRASIPVFPAGSVSTASLARTFVTASSITLSYALRIDAAPAQGEQQIMVVSVSPPASNGDFFHTYLLVNATSVRLVEETFPAGASAGGSFVASTLAVPVVFGVWQQIDMTVVLTGVPHVTLHVDGMVAFDGSAPAFYRPGVAAVAAGVHYAYTPSGPLSVHVDDLYVDLK